MFRLPRLVICPYFQLSWWILFYHFLFCEQLLENVLLHLFHPAEQFIEEKVVGVPSHDFLKLFLQLLHSLIWIKMPPFAASTLEKLSSFNQTIKYNIPEPIELSTIFRDSTTIYHLPGTWSWRSSSWGHCCSPRISRSRASMWPGPGRGRGRGWAWSTPCWRPGGCTA